MAQSVDFTWGAPFNWDANVDDNIRTSNVEEGSLLLQFPTYSEGECPALWSSALPGDFDVVPFWL